jgi:hypothetical protein
MPTTLDAFRVYTADELAKDGYPPEWHATIKHAVRAAAGNRCVRCGHPYRNGEHGTGEWSLCDDHCTHGGPIRMLAHDTRAWTGNVIDYDGCVAGEKVSGNRHDQAAWGAAEMDIEAQWRILTVHHLDGDKANCRWWNLASLCQRCHLEIQGRVRLAQVYPFEHSDWFRPYAAGYYAFAYLGEDLSREDVEERLEELLALERVA